MAGLDGIQNRIEPHEPVDKDLYELPPEEAKNIPQVPNSLLDSLEALRNDHEFLTKGGVFTEELIETWIEYKIENEIQPLAQRPHTVRVRAVLRRLTPDALAPRFSVPSRAETRGAMLFRAQSTPKGRPAHARSARNPRGVGTRVP